MKPLISDPTESFSAMAYAIVQQHEAVRLLERDFDREVCRSAAWRANDDAMTVALGVDDLPTVVER